jgi:hypothetical protein
MEGYRTGSLTVREFCRGDSVSVTSFYQWQKKLAQPAAKPVFVPLTVP